MAATSAAPPQSTRIPFNRIFITGLLAIVAAALANTVVRFITVMLFGIDPAFGPLQLMTPIMFTVIGVLGGVIVFAILSRTVQRPVHAFRIVALGVLLVSLIPDVLLFFADATLIPGITVPGILALMVMHFVSWAITVGFLSPLERA